MAERKYASISSVTALVRNITAKFSQIGHKHTSSEITDLKIPTKVSELTNDSGYVTNATSAGSSLGLVKSGGDVTISSGVITVKDDSHNHVIDNVDGLQAALDSKASSTHNHDSVYDSKGAASTALEEAKTYTDEITSSKANLTHTHSKSEVGLGNVDNTADSAKSVKYATSAGSATSATKATQDASGNVITTTYETKSDATTKYDELTEAIGGKSDTGHTHSIANVTNLQSSLDAKVPTTRTINSKPLSSNITLSASDVGAATTANVNSAVSTHNTSTSAHNDIRNLITALSTKVNNFLDVDDTTTDQLSEVLALIDANKGTLESLTTAKINVSDIVDNLTTNSTGKVLSAKQGVAIKALIDALQEELDDHTHAIADVSGLQSALDGKAASSHGTHVSYSTTAPVMDGTASVGSASTVARSDHKHPTDTSRASKSEFDAHVADTTKHITATERTNWGTAYTHSQAAHAPSNAQPNQNAFSNIAVSGQTTVAADTTTDTVTFVGSNVTITTDATNDKVTFTVANGSTSAKGIVQLTNSTSSTSTTTAATPSSVKSAYDLANTAKTNAATAQSRADSAYSLAEGKAESLSDLGVTATATELNYVDGVTSAIQTQLNGKAASSHKHAASDITSGTIATARLPQASDTAAGITVVYPSAKCTTFSSDSGTVTPLAVQKGAKMFAITRPSATTNKAVARYSNTTGDVQDSKILIEDVTNTKDTSKKANVLSIPAEGGKKMVYGYCTDQVDGTAFIGGVFDANATVFPYAQGLAIGGTSGNLLWKGVKVATMTDVTEAINTAMTVDTTTTV